MNYGKVLVTGGAGFLGSNLVKKLLPVSEHIYVIDDLSTGDIQNLPNSATITFYKGCITNGALLEEIMPIVDNIFHLACRNLYLSTMDLFQDFNTNLYGGLCLLLKAHSHCKHLKRFVYTSTASIYGDASVIPTPETQYHQTTMPYAASKFGTEHYVQVFFHMYNLPVTTLRLSNVYGPGQSARNPYSGVVTKFFDAIQNVAPLHIFDDGSQTRDFTFVDDAIDAILLASNQPHTIGKVYNVGTGIETSINLLAETIYQIAGYDKYPVEYYPKRIVDKVYRRAVNIEAIRKVVGFTPQYSLKDGLQKTYVWAKQQQ